MKMVRLIKMCLNETYSRVHIGKHLSDMFPVKNGLKKGDDLSPLLLKYTVEHAIRRVQVNLGGLNLNGAHQLLVYADDVNILCGSIHTTKTNTTALVAAIKEILLEVNADKTKYMVMSQDENAGRSHNIKIDNNSFKRVKQFKYFGTTLMNQNCIQEEI